VFVRFARPTLELATDELKRRAAQELSFDKDNSASKPVIAGFEVQIDDNAQGDTTKDFYGIPPSRTGSTNPGTRWRGATSGSRRHSVGRHACRRPEDLPV
jgi:hypothetical protein